MVQAGRDDVAGERAPSDDARADGQEPGPDAQDVRADGDELRPDAQELRPDGRATRWDEHRAARRLELVRAARRSVHERGPDVSMDELATDIGTSKSILYRYFTDKAGLQRAVGRHVLERMLRELTEAASGLGGPRERIHSMVSQYLSMVDDAPHVYAFVTSPSSEASGELRGFVAEVDAVVAHTLVPAVLGLDDDSDVESIPRELAARATLWASGVTGTVRSVADRWLAARAALEREELESATDEHAGRGTPADGGSADGGSVVHLGGVNGAVPTMDGPGRGARPGSAVGPSVATPTTDGPGRAGGPGPAVGGPLHPDLDRTLAAINRSELAAFIASWLWDGAVGVLRRARTDTRPRTVTQNRPDKDVS